MRWEPSIAPDHRQMRHGSLMAAPKRFEFIADARFQSVHLAVGIEGAAKFHIRRPNTGVVCAPIFPLERLMWEIRRRTRGGHLLDPKSSRMAISSRQPHD